MTHSVHPFITSSREGSIAIDEAPDKITVTLTITGGAVTEGSRDAAELRAAFEPLMASIRHDPRMIEFVDTHSGQRNLVRPRKGTLHAHA